MAEKKRGAQSVLLERRPRLLSFASMAGPKEAEGPLAGTFDETFSDDTLGEKSWERGEARMLEHTVDLALSKAGLETRDVDVFLGGDLLNQIVTSSYTARQLGVPFLGIYGACSTMAESLLLGGLLVDGGYADRVVCATSSHFATAERQYRFPLELGNQRTPTAQWTVTGAGATILGLGDAPVCLTSATIGRVVDLQQTDINNMGAAMAPAAADTLLAHLRDLHRSVQDYDLIVTGDLGHIGYDLMCLLCEKAGVHLDGRYIDCGCEIFSPEQDVHAGGSGCGCSACCLNGWLLHRLLDGEIRRLLFLATGALMSTTTSQQGESIPAVAHAVTLEVTQA
ncbi:MAG: stage V sporulation protein AD [Candidatus Spyradocola sp.]|jgi:stage V sporulation protein AD